MLKCHLGLGPWTAAQSKLYIYDIISTKRRYIQWNCPLTFFHTDDYNKLLRSPANVETMVFKLKFQNSKGFQERERCLNRNMSRADRVFSTTHSG